MFRAASGIPISRVTNMQSSLPVFFDGRLTDGRTPVFTQTNLKLTQDVPLPGNTRAQVDVRTSRTCSTRTRRPTCSAT